MSPGPTPRLRPLDAGPARRPVLPVLVAIVLPLLLLGPALGSGFVLSYDMVWVPDLALRTDQLGLGTAVPRAVPSDAVVAVLDELVPGMVLQKLVLYGALVLAALGSARLVGPSVVAGCVAVTFTVWNPFVVERLWIGHWPVLLGYAVVPWLVLAGRRTAADGRIPPLTYLLLPVGSLSASAGLVSALVLLLSSVGAGRSRLRLAVLCLAVNAPWLVAGLRQAGVARSDGGTEVFALNGEGGMPAPLSALGLGGIWNAEVVPASREGLLAWVALVGVLGLAALGARPWWAGQPRPDARALVWLWAIGYLAAVATWATPGTVGWVSAHVPGGALLRDGTRSLALCLPLLVGLLAAGADRLVSSVREVGVQVALAVACAAAPVAVLADAAWGIGGYLRAVDYPLGWSDARTAVSGTQAPGDLLVLPFTSYRAPEWNSGHKVLDPLGRYLPRNYLVNDELVVSGRRVPGEDPRSEQVLRALALETPQERARALGVLGIGLVAHELDTPGAGDPPYDAEVAGSTLYGDAELVVGSVAAPVAERSPGLGEVLWVGVGWAAFVAALGWGAVRLAARAVERVRATHPRADGYRRGTFW